MSDAETPDVTHLALVSPDSAPRPQCDGTGRSVMRIDEVTCPACLQLVADRTGCAIAQAEAEIHDAHAIPAGDEPLAALTPAAPTLADLALSWAKYADAIGQDDPFEASILRQCAEALERALTSARIVPAAAIVLDQPTDETTADLAAELEIDIADLITTKPGYVVVGELLPDSDYGRIELTPGQVRTLAARLALAAADAETPGTGA